MGKERSKLLSEELANKTSEREQEKPVRDGSENKKAASKKPAPDQLDAQEPAPDESFNEQSVNKQSGQQQKKQENKAPQKLTNQAPAKQQKEKKAQSEKPVNQNQEQQQKKETEREKQASQNLNQQQKEKKKAVQEKAIGQNSDQQQTQKKETAQEKQASLNLNQKQKEKKKTAPKNPSKETITLLKGLPNAPSSFAILIGAMKCGTTSLYSSLVNHPVICPCIEKEPGYFTNLDLPLADYNEDTFQKYQSLWPTWDSKIHQFAIEASTSYSKCPDFPNAAQRIKRLKKLTGAQFKFIYVIRDPVALATSFYRHAMTDINWGKHTVKKLLADGKLARGLRVICSYAKQLDFYHNNFGRDNILILHFEDMVHSSETTLAEIYRFLGLEIDGGLNSALIHTHSSKKRVADFFENHSEHVYPGLTPEKMLAWELSDDHKSQIRNWLKDDVRVLKNKYGIDTSHWTY